MEDHVSDIPRSNPSRARRHTGQDSGIGLPLLFVACAVAAGCAPPAGRSGGPPALKAPLPAAPSARRPAVSRRGPLRPLVFYIPNRMLDLLDVVSFGIGLPSLPDSFPSYAHANVHASRAMQAGAGSTDGWFVGIGYGRAFAWRLRHRELSLGPLTMCELHRSGRPGGDVERVGILLPSDPPFELGAMDYWAVGGHAGLLLVAASVDAHPAELFDAVAGFFFIDLTGDDY